MLRQKVRQKKTPSTKREFNLQRFLIGGLRRLSYRTPMRSECMNKFRVAYGQYKCNLCKFTFRRKDVQVDHFQPVVPVTGFDDWNGYIERLFCDSLGLQVVCRPCHKEKSKAENAARRSK